MGATRSNAWLSVVPDEVVQTGAGEMRKRSVVISGHRTSVSLETAFWSSLKQIAGQRGLSVNRLVEALDSSRGSNLSSAIRVFVLQHYQAPTANAATLPG